MGRFCDRQRAHASWLFGRINSRSGVTATEKGAQLIIALLIFPKEKKMLQDLSDWLSHPLYSKGTVAEWLAGLVLVVLIAFAWSQVVNSIE